MNSTKQRLGSQTTLRSALLGPPIIGSQRFEEDVRRVQQVFRRTSPHACESLYPTEHKNLRPGSLKAALPP